jgi:hypothetical protein
VAGIRDELKPDDRVALFGVDETYRLRLFDSVREAPEHAGEEGFVLEVQEDATAECRVRLDSGEIVSVKPRWLSKIEPLDPALVAHFGKYGERAEGYRGGLRRA